MSLEETLGEDIPLTLPEDATLSVRGPAPEGATAATIAPLAEWSVATLPGNSPADASPADSGPGYRLLHQVGAGGMGEVYAAIQSSLGRVVAVKRIRSERLESDTDSRRRRETMFRHEAMISARLEHPNIVPIHDLGTDADGTPLMAMKLVEGESWDRVLRDDFASLAVPDFLGKHIPILAAAAQAVAFAHSRQIVHRDLKPAQVILGPYGEVLLTDWGLAASFGDAAKLGAQAELPELPSLHTASSPSGTPALMAPEQTSLSAMGIGPWTDIYLLGGTLYYLLTGTFPHESGSAREAMRRAAKGIVEPPRQRNPKRDIPAELETVCMRCLAIDPRERPASAREFVAALNDYSTGAGRRREAAAAVQHAAARLAEAGRDYKAFGDVLTRLGQAETLWPDNPDLAPLRERALAAYAEAALANGDLMLARVQAERMEHAAAGRSPLLARVESAEAEAARRARQRLQLLKATVALMALVVAGTAFFMVRIRREQQIAEARRIEADRARNGSDELVQFMITDLRGRLKELERLDILNEAAEKAHAHYKSLPRETMGGPELLRTAAGLRSVSELFSEQGRTTDALAAAEAARADVELHLKRGGDFLGALPALAEVVEREGRSLARVSRADAALQVYRSFVDRLKPYAGRPETAQIIASYESRVGGALKDIGRLDDATALLEDLFARTLKSASARGTPTAADRRLVGSIGVHLGSTYDSAGKASEAVDVLERSIAMLSPIFGTAESLPTDRGIMANLQGFLGSARASAGQWAPAIEAKRASIALWQQIIEGDPTNVTTLQGYIGVQQSLADVLLKAGRIDDAAAAATSTVEAAERLVSIDPADRMSRELLIGCCQKAAEIGARIGDATGALRHAARAIAAAREGIALEPRSMTAKRLLMLSLNYHTTAQAILGRATDSQEHGLEAVALAEELLAAEPANSRRLRECAEAYGFLARAYPVPARLDEQAAAFRKAWEFADRAAEVAPDELVIQYSRSTYRQNSARALADNNRVAEAAAILDEAVAISTASRARFPDSANIASTAFRVLRDHAYVMTLQDRMEDAAEDYRKATEIGRELGRGGMDVSVESTVFSLACDYAFSYALRGFLQESIDINREAFDRLAAIAPMPFLVGTLACEAAWHLGNSYARAGRDVEARDAYRAGIALGAASEAAESTNYSRQALWMTALALANCEARLGNFDAAELAAQQAEGCVTSLDPDGLFRRFGVAEARATILYRQGRKSEAADALCAVLRGLESLAAAEGQGARAADLHRIRRAAAELLIGAGRAAEAQPIADEALAAAEERAVGRKAHVRLRMNRAEALELAARACTLAGDALGAEGLYRNAEELLAAEPVARDLSWSRTRLLVAAGLRLRDAIEPRRQDFAKFAPSDEVNAALQRMNDAPR